MELALNLIETLPRPKAGGGTRPSDQPPRSFLPLLKEQLLRSPREAGAAPAADTRQGRYQPVDPGPESTPGAAVSWREADSGSAEQMLAGPVLEPAREAGGSCCEVPPGLLLELVPEVLAALIAAAGSPTGVLTEPVLVMTASSAEASAAAGHSRGTGLLGWMLEPGSQGLTARDRTAAAAGARLTSGSQPASIRDPAAAPRLEVQLAPFPEQLAGFQNGEKGQPGKSRQPLLDAARSPAAYPRQVLARITELLSALNGQPAAGPGRGQPPLPGIETKLGRQLEPLPGFDSDQPIAVAPAKAPLPPGVSELYQLLRGYLSDTSPAGARPPTAAGERRGEPPPTPLAPGPDGLSVAAAEKGSVAGLEAVPATAGPGAELPEGAGQPPDLREDSIPLPPLIRPVVAGIRKVSRGGRTEMSLQLKPESLGRLSLTVAVEDGRVTARLQAESHAVGRLIESSLGQLKQALQEQGLRLDRLEVAVGESSVQQDLGQQLSRQYQAPPDGSPPRLLMTAGMGEESIAYAIKRESAGRCWPNGHIDCLA